MKKTLFCVLALVVLIYGWATAFFATLVAGAALLLVALFILLFAPRPR